MSLSCAPLFFAVVLCSLCMTVSGATEMLHLNEGLMQTEQRNSSNTSAPGAPQERAITKNEITALLNYHNLVRSEVLTPAANMESMVWNATLAMLASSWASQCTWAHGPDAVLKTNGQNMGVSSSSSNPILDLAKSWNFERYSYSYPTCFGSVCGHYTQMVWATSTQLGCDVRSCSNMNVSGKIWKLATLLVCNYYPKGNRVGVAPYYPGKPCSACPSRYGGSCTNNLCTKPISL